MHWWSLMCRLLKDARRHWKINSSTRLNPITSLPHGMLAWAYDENRAWTSGLFKKALRVSFAFNSLPAFICIYSRPVDPCQNPCSLYTDFPEKSTCWGVLRRWGGWNVARILQSRSQVQLRGWGFSPSLMPQMMWGSTHTRSFKIAFLQKSMILHVDIHWPILETAIERWL